MEGRAFENFQKKHFKIPWRPKIVPKSVQRCFEHVLGRFFRIKLFAQCSMDGRAFESFQKNQKFQISQIALNRFQKCPNVFWTYFGAVISKKFFAQCSMEGWVSEKHQKSKEAQNRSQKWSNMFWKCLGVTFLKKFFCPVFRGGSSLRKFSKKSKKFQNSKNAFNRFQKCPHVFWECFGAIYPNFFAQCLMQGFSDFLDLKIWVQFFGLKNRSLVFRT